MKVDIITMHCPLNYGAVLQTYALTRYITSLGHQVEVIDYRPQYLVGNQDLTFVPEWVKQRNLLFKLAYLLIKIPNKIIRKHKFHKFLKLYISLTRKYQTYKELQDNPPKADRYICGSDQIWGWTYGGYKDPAYFLGFIDDGNICASYAASGHIPNPLPEDMIRVMIPLIKQLKLISVREEDTANLLKQYVDKQIYHVLDPVFLLPKEEWRKIVPETKFTNDKYVLVYSVGDTENVYKLAKIVADQYKLPIYCITGSQRRDSRIQKFICPNPTDFLSIFNSAEYVVTNSFHGTAFSIIFEKKFYVCQTEIAPSRIISLLKNAKCEFALIDVSESENSSKPINHAISSASNLQSDILISKEYLSRVLS